MFPNLELLVEVIFSFPRSNAEAERIFFNSYKRKK